MMRNTMTLAAFASRLANDRYISSVVAIGDIVKGTLRCHSAHLDRLLIAQTRADLYGFSTHVSFVDGRGTLTVAVVG